MSNFQTYGSNPTGDIDPSNKIWNRFRKYAGRPEQVRSIFHDFRVEQPTFASAVGQGGMITYQDTGVTIQGEATVDAGLVVTHDGTDNDEGSICGGKGVCGVISTTAGADNLLAWEMSVSKSSVANDGLAFFAGLAEENTAIADIMVDNDGVLKTTADFIGFRCLQDDGDSLDVIYQKASQTLQSIKDALQAIAASTYYKLGQVYDPSAPADKRITSYVNGVDIGYYVTATQLAAATFPNGEELTWLFATKIGTASAFSARLRWVKFMQLR